MSYPSNTTRPYVKVYGDLGENARFGWMIFEPDGDGITYTNFTSPGHRFVRKDVRIDSSGCLPPTDILVPNGLGVPSKMTYTIRLVDRNGNLLHTYENVLFEPGTEQDVNALVYAPNKIRGDWDLIGQPSPAEVTPSGVMYEETPIPTGFPKNRALTLGQVLPKDRQLGIVGLELRPVVDPNNLPAEPASDEFRFQPYPLWASLFEGQLTDGRLILSVQGVREVLSSWAQIGGTGSRQSLGEIVPLTSRKIDYVVRSFALSHPFAKIPIDPED